MRPAIPCLAGAIRLREGLENPGAGKFDDEKSHRAALGLAVDHFLVSSMGHYGRFYANAARAAGVVSAGRNMDRLPIAAYRRGMSRIDNNKFAVLLFLTTRLLRRVMKSPMEVE